MNKLEELAQLVGIENVVPRVDGQEQPITDDTRRALLASMGLSVGTEDQVLEALLSVQQRNWTRALPAVLVLRVTEPEITIPVIVPVDSTSLHWRLTLEDGSVRSGQSDPGRLRLLDEHNANGYHLERRALTLAGPHVEGYHTLHVGADGPSCRLIMTPGKCWLPQEPRDGHRLWGLAAQLYLLRSEQNWGIGDFEDLRRLTQMAGSQGADVVGVNPLHAMFLDTPAEASPYSPSDRLLLNVLNICVEELPELSACVEARGLIDSGDFQARLKACREANLVDYEAVAALKLPILQLLFRAFESKSGEEAHEALRKFHAERRDMLDRSCTFQALRLHLAAQDAAWTDSAKWPIEFRDYDAPGVQEFRVSHGGLVRFQLWLQWVADRQLSRVKEVAGEMAVGFYRDLAVGSHQSGAETWSNPDLFADSCKIGAPPDQFNPKGQNWALPPLDPKALEKHAYGPFIDLLRANMRYAGALRIDHVMALRRLYWIPRNGGPQDGAYVRYPIDDLIGIIALESQRSRCLVIGEDLGGVPDGLRDCLAKANILSYRVLSFERDAETFHPAGSYPALSLSVAGNHDLPTLAGWWSGVDIDLREKLQLFPTADSAAEARAMRDKDRQDLVAVFCAEGLVDSGRVLNSREFGIAAHEFLSRTNSLLTMVQFDDLAEEPEQVNVPGTSSEYPNWRRKTSIPLEQLASEGALPRIASIMHSDTPPSRPRLDPSPSV